MNTNLSMVIEYWLNQPNADWATLIKAVEGPLVQQKSVADDIYKFLVQLSNDI